MTLRQIFCMSGLGDQVPRAVCKALGPLSFLGLALMLSIASYMLSYLKFLHVVSYWKTRAVLILFYSVRNFDLKEQGARNKKNSSTYLYYRFWSYWARRRQIGHGRVPVNRLLIAYMSRHQDRDRSQVSESLHEMEPITQATLAQHKFFCDLNNSFFESGQLYKVPHLPSIYSSHNHSVQHWHYGSKSWNRRTNLR